MHMAEGARLGLDYSYALIDFDALGLTDAALGDRARACGDARLRRPQRHPSLQAEHHRRISTSCRQRPRRSARSTRSCSTEARRSATTPIAGVLPRASGRRCRTRRLDRVLLLGAGGAGKAVARALLRPRRQARSRSSTSIRSDRRISPRSLNSAPGAIARAVARRLSRRPRGSASGLVNATPVGMAKYPGHAGAARRAAARSLGRRHRLFPGRDRAASRGRGRRLPHLPGRGMAVFQAVKAFELITGRRPDAEAMFRHFASAAGRIAAPARLT